MLGSAAVKGGANWIVTNIEIALIRVGLTRYAFNGRPIALTLTEHSSVHGLDRMKLSLAVGSSHRKDRAARPEKSRVKENQNMSHVIYQIVEHDGAWAYKVGDVFSETFPSRELAQ